MDAGKTRLFKILLGLRSPVKGKVKIEFLLFLTEKNVSYQMLFTWSKNIGPCQSYLNYNLQYASELL